MNGARHVIWHGRPAAGSWDDVHKDREWGECPEPCMARFIMRRFGDADRASVKVLDLGCGTGANSDWMAIRGFDVRACDSSVTAIRRASARLRQHVLFTQADAVSLPWVAQSFDAIVDVCCLQHVEDIGRALSEVRRVLKPGGWFFSMIANANHSPQAFNGMPYRVVDPDELQSVFQASTWAQQVVENVARTDRGMLISHWLIELQAPS